MSDLLIGIDTNIIIRLLTQDNKMQFEMAARLVAAHPDENSIVVNPIVILEAVWVLTSQYAMKPLNARLIINNFMMSKEFLVPESMSTLGWRDWLNMEHPDLADILISMINSSCSCKTTYTLDKLAAKNIPGMSLLT